MEEGFGGYLEGRDGASDVIIGVKLAKAGYSIAVVFIACLLAVQAYLWVYCTDILDISLTVLKGMALSLPLIIVRVTYLFPSVLSGSDLRWNSLAGPNAPFLLMGLLMEYTVVCIHLVTGYIIPCWRQIQKDQRVQLTGSSSVEEL
ncbi:hypothetical protein BDV27DRAFT_151695 [Aspergillus caelatus]|uniref:DUF7702 domain-containing protein n=1 Tax=Aspergillus caelatus TaxID=61420 RepID=A0A5N7ALW2_9EURO|nr:uncharacterized protein BDV27DRAFT_151695 [Aspergillus caelatus]KAE8370841.1 hypothetical protein BDV27DRAFT_151695 [Aspergillus caelatus]